MKKTAVALSFLLLTSCAAPTADIAGILVSCTTLQTQNVDKPIELGCLDGSAGASVNAIRGPAIINVWGSWCAPCKVMEEDIFTQTEVFRYLNARFLNFRTNFDAESGKTIAAIYEVTQLPTILFLNPQGVVLERHTGIANPSVLTALGNAALQKMGN